MSPRATRSEHLCIAPMMVLGLAMWSSAGCGEIRHAADAQPSPIDAIPDANLACVDGLIDSLGATGLSTETGTDDFAASCGGEGSADQAFRWIAPVTDYYVFDTFGSQFDTVLSLMDGCDGSELACSNNVGQSPHSELVRKLEQGEEMVIVVDGAAGDRGPGTLNIQRVTCPDSDLEGQSFPLELSAVGFGDDFASHCGGAGHDDRAYHWVAPSAGLYSFRVTAETFTPVISLIDGPRCQDRLLGCNRAQRGDLGAEVVRYLDAGQSVSVVVDGADGAGLFTLDIRLRDQGPMCPDSVLLDRVELVGQQFSSRSLAPSCSFVRAAGAFGGVVETRDKTYVFESPPRGDCFGRCDITATARQRPLVLYRLEGDDCGGAEMECTIGEPLAGSDLFSAAISFPIEDEAVRHTVVVAEHGDGFMGDDTFSINVLCLIACP